MVPINVVYDICRHYMKDLAQVVSPTLISLVDGFRRSRNLVGLSTCSRHFDAEKHKVDDWRFLRQIEAFFRKNALFALQTVCEQAAKDSFVQSEASCSSTNRRLQPLIGYPYLIDERYRYQVLQMTRYIRNVLGDFQSFLGALPYLVRVTSGATSTRSRRDSLPQLKLKMRLFSTKRAAPYVKGIYETFGFNAPHMKTTHTNRVVLVPKNWKTDRTIACEPEGNLPLQLAFDSYAKRRLRLFGINLSDQSANQRLAKYASIHNNYVTVDFSAASDTISFNTVSLLFPEDWFKYLWDVRTPCYRGVFGNGTYAKFSSMGNGSTFTIETLIFAAACHAVGSQNFLVYGDDVIIEKEYYEDFLALTRFLGFTVNVSKTFTSGPFRESCGGDYFNGSDVTPVYIRNIDLRKANLCHLINTLESIAFTGGALEAYLLTLVKKYKLPLVPYNESTISGVWIHPDTAQRRGILKVKRGLHTFRAYTPKSIKRMFGDSRGYYLWFLHKNSQVLFSEPWEANARVLNPRHDETSSAPVFDHVYVRKRVGWVPAEGMPDHLYWWSELICTL